MTTAAKDGVNEENQSEEKGPLEDLVRVNFTKDSHNSTKDNSTSKDNANKPHPVVAYKYSDNKRKLLHESVMLAGRPMFIRYKNGQVKAVEQIDEGSRIVRPPSREECPYPVYEFAQLNEVEAYINRVKNLVTGIESPYSILKEIVLKYVDQEEPIIILLVADIIWSYFQDLFSTTHYIHATGGNETGKITWDLYFNIQDTGL